ncbi:MAG: glycosyl hydrolase [Betaproteobacteria bacterium]|nr:glycosyl hydrolase [Betaproteobacteria bacterium]
MKLKLEIQIALTLALLTQVPATVAADPPAAPPRLFREAPQIAKVEVAPILAAAYTGKRVVAVGDFGIVILSDDGKIFRQAKTVPTRSVLTSVFFIDAEHGWAVGHDGTVIATSDAGETWQVLRVESGKDRVLLSVWFENAQHGFAVGQFGLVLETADGGKTWNERRLLEGDAGDKHLLQIVPAGAGLVLMVAEAGAILRSEDSGKSWQLVQTDNRGSFWTGLALNDGTLLVAGMRGHIYRSTDRGLTWKEVPSTTLQSLTGLVQNKDGTVRVAGLSGTVLSSKDQGQTYTASVLPERNNLTAIVNGPAGELLFSLGGLVKTPRGG